jgi:flagellar P-ring protein precursor FlgI
MKKLAVILSLLTAAPIYDVSAYSRIKDIVYFEGVRENALVGYGLVVGLQGTGDNLRNSGFTQNSLINHLNKMGVSTTNINNLNTRNVAAVMVTANLPPFAHPGNLMSVQVSTMGDAKSLKGGNLLATPLVGADGQVYGIAQGQISIGAPATMDQTKNKPTPTSGYIANGAVVEQSIGFDMNSLNEVKLALKNPDITTARIVATAINAQLRDEFASAKDPGTVVVRVPLEYRNNVLDFLADIEGLTVDPDTVAKIVIDEATGTVVIGENVRISKVAVAQGNLVLKVSDTEKLQMFLDDGENEQSMPGTKLATLESQATLSDLVQGLNSLGVSPQDLIAILKTIQQAGALQATIEVK